MTLHFEFSNRKAEKLIEYSGSSTRTEYLKKSISERKWCKHQRVRSINYWTRSYHEDNTSPKE